MKLCLQGPVLSLHPRHALCHRLHLAPLRRRRGLGLLGARCGRRQARLGGHQRPAWARRAAWVRKSAGPARGASTAALPRAAPLQLLGTLPLGCQGASFARGGLGAPVELGLQRVSLRIKGAHNAAQLRHLSVAALLA